MIANTMQSRIKPSLASSDIVLPRSISQHLTPKTAQRVLSNDWDMGVEALPPYYSWGAEQSSGYRRRKLPMKARTSGH
jgi:hypothetical protein